MDYRKLINYILDKIHFSDDNIFAEVSYVEDIIQIVNKKNKKTICITVRDHSIYCNDYSMEEKIYESNFEGADECIKQVLNMIKFGFDIYGFDETRKRIYRSSYFDETQDESIMTSGCKEAIKNHKEIKYISASNFIGDKVIKFYVQNDKLTKVD